jgi:hypothetical protein
MRDVISPNACHRKDFNTQTIDASKATLATLYIRAGGLRQTKNGTARQQSPQEVGNDGFLKCVRQANIHV